MKITKTDLIQQIKARSPWYQRIEFPEYGITTTDDISNIWDSTAPDNRIGGLTAKEASQMRPMPKWDSIKHFLPDISKLDVLEVGSNNGFFSFKFAELGAKSVLGLDVNAEWLDNARWACQVLELQNVSFELRDFMLFGDGTGDVGMMQNQANISIPQNQVDVIFSSTVINHMFFPMFAIYKMLCVARQYVIIDFPVLPPTQENESKMRLDLGEGYHAFIFSKELLQDIVNRFGIPHDDIHINTYNNNLAVTFVINTANRRPIKGA